MYELPLDGPTLAANTKFLALGKKSAAVRVLACSSCYEKRYRVA